MDAILEIGDLTVVIGDGEFDEGYLQAVEDPGAIHLPPRTERRRATRCWLVAAPGQRFTVHYRWNGRSRTGNRRGAGLFCELSVDGFIIERAFLPLKAGTGERGTIQREWEIPGRFFRTNDGLPRQLPFRFGQRVVDSGAEHGPDTGSIQVVLYWARQNQNVPTLFPPPTEALAQGIATMLRTPVAEDGLRLCVDLRDPEDSEVVENDLRVERVDDLAYAFIFVYAQPDFIANSTPVQTGVTAL